MVPMRGALSFEFNCASMVGNSRYENKLLVLNAFKLSASRTGSLK